MGDWECGEWNGQQIFWAFLPCRWMSFKTVLKGFSGMQSTQCPTSTSRSVWHTWPYLPNVHTLMNQAMNHLRISPGCSVCCHILLYAGSCGGAGADLRRGGERGVAKLWISHISAPQVHLYSWVAFRCRNYQVKVRKESNRMRYNVSKEPIWRGWGGCEHLSVAGLQHLGGQLCHSGPG